VDATRWSTAFRVHTFSHTPGTAPRARITAHKWTRPARGGGAEPCRTGASHTPRAQSVRGGHRPAAPSPETSHAPPYRRPLPEPGDDHSRGKSARAIHGNNPPAHRPQTAPSPPGPTGPPAWNTARSHQHGCSVAGSGRVGVGRLRVHGSGTGSSMVGSGSAGYGCTARVRGSSMVGSGSAGYGCTARVRGSSVVGSGRWRWVCGWLGFQLLPRLSPRWRSATGLPPGEVPSGGLVRYPAWRPRPDLSRSCSSPVRRWSRSVRPAQYCAPKEMGPGGGHVRQISPCRACCIPGHRRGTGYGRQRGLRRWGTQGDRPSHATTLFVVSRKVTGPQGPCHLPPSLGNTPQQTLARHHE
jgi:hypothetical protein